tara:strand:- start:11449 stop:12471 length:1023 start_codon:yes stop_codon:yes gene_type:complete
MGEVINFEDFVETMSPKQRDKLAPVVIDRPPSIRARSRDLFEMEVPDEPTKNLFNDDNPVFLYGIIVANSIKHGDSNYFGRKFYEREHDPNQKAGPPNCFSSDSIKPHPDIPHPISPEGCKMCPMAKGPNRRARCTYEARVAVALVDWQGKPTFEKPYSGFGFNNSIFQLTVPHASIFATDSKNEVGLNPYIMKLRQFGFLPRQIITRIGFFQYPAGSKGPKKLIYPKLHFSAVGSVAPHDKYPSLENGQEWSDALDKYFDEDGRILTDETLKRFVTVKYPTAEASDEAPQSEVKVEAPVESETSHIELKTRKKKSKPKSEDTNILDSLLADDEGESDDE